VLQAGHARALERHRRELIALPRAGNLELDDLDLDVVADGVVRPHRAIDRAAVVEAAVDVLQEVRRAERRPRVDFDLDIPLARLEDDDDVGGRLAGKRRHGGEGSSQERAGESPEAGHNGSV
jgi:hypothetical protein